MSHVLPPLAKNKNAEKERRDSDGGDEIATPGATVILEPLKKTTEGKAFFEVAADTLRVTYVQPLHSEESVMMTVPRTPHKKSGTSKRSSASKKVPEPTAPPAEPPVEVPVEVPPEKPAEAEGDSSTWRRRIPLPPAVTAAASTAAAPTSSATASPKSIQQRPENAMPSPPPAKAGRKESVEEFRRTLVASPPAKKADCSSPHAHSQLEGRKLKELAHTTEPMGRVEKADRFPAHPPKGPSPYVGRQGGAGPGSDDAPADAIEGGRPPPRDSSSSPIIYVSKTPPSKVKRRRDGGAPGSPEKPAVSSNLHSKKSSNFSSHHLINIQSFASDGSFTGGRLTAQPSCDTSNLDNVSCLTISAAPQLCSYASNDSSLLL